MTPNHSRLALHAAFLAAGAAVFALGYWRLQGFLIDDVFISVRYAHHLMQGHGLVYNVGERVEGYTNFLWTLLIAPGLGLGLAPWIKSFNAAWALAASLLTVRLASTLSRETEPATAIGEPTAAPAWWIALPGALCLASSPFLLSAAEGLETMMFTALLLLTVIATLEARESERAPGAALALIALGLTRPDGWAYLPWMLAVARGRGRSWAWVARAGLLAGIGLAAHEVFRLACYGAWLPNTMSAKGGGTGYLIDRGWSQLCEWIVRTGGWTWLAVLLPLAPRKARGAALAVLAAILIRVAFHVWSGGPWLARGRFLTPILPLALVMLVWGAAIVGRRGKRQVLTASVAAALVLMASWRAYPAIEAGSRSYGEALRAAHGRLGADVATWTDSSAVMAMDDAGLGPLVAGRTNVDMLGLNDAHLGRLPGEFGVKSDPGYVLGREPEVIVLMSRRPPPIGPLDLFVQSQIPLFEHPAFRERYRFAREYEFMPEYRLLLYARTDSKLVKPELFAAP